MGGGDGLGMKSVTKTRDAFRFEIIKQSSKSQARVGKIYTPHGTINTPAFVPVGTNATLKAVTHHQAEQIGVELMFSNTYHLLVHPGADVIERAGGIHKWSGRDRPFITDSGGFQVFSLSEGKLENENLKAEIALGKVLL